MGHATKEQPKCLSVLAGKSLLDWQIESLRAAGIDEIAVVCGYKGEMLFRPGLSTFENRRWSETNMVMSLACASEWLSADTCVVSYSDIIYSENTVACVKNCRGEIVVGFDREWFRLWSARFEDPLSDAETFRTDADGILTEIGNRPKSIDEVEGQYTGLLKFSPSGWSHVESFLNGLTPEMRDKIDMTSMLHGLIKYGVKVNTVPIQGGWYEVDSESDLNLYNRWAMTRKGGLWAGC